MNVDQAKKLLGIKHKLLLGKSIHEKNYPHEFSNLMFNEVVNNNDITETGIEWLVFDEDRELCKIMHEIFISQTVEDIDDIFHNYKDQWEKMINQ